MKNLLLLILATMAAGCVIQNVSPVKDIAEEQVCVQRNPSLKGDILRIYTNRLKENGYRFAVVDTQEEGRACAFWSTYIARWGNWGMHHGVYLSYAEINVFKQDDVIGKVMYRVPGGNPFKWGRTAPKIDELVDELFPPRKP